MEEEYSLAGTPCPKIDKETGKPCCIGKMKEIPGKKDAWKCTRCGIEIWQGCIPTWEEYRDMLRPTRTTELMGMSGPINRKGGSKSGRNKKKKKSGPRFYYFDNKPKR